MSSSTMRMTSREIAELVGSRHDKVKQSIERLATGKENKPAVICLPPLWEYLDNLGRPASEYICSGEQGKRDSIECEKRLKQVVNQSVPMLSEYEKDLKVIGVIAEVLRVSESSKLGMVKTYCEKHVSRVAPLLPSYAVDSPTGSTVGSVNMKKQAFTEK